MSDIDECDENIGCADNDITTDCNNTVGNFTCACKPGYDPVGSGPRVTPCTRKYKATI